MLTALYACRSPEVSAFGARINTPKSRVYASREDIVGRTIDMSSITSRARAHSDTAAEHWTRSLCKQVTFARHNLQLIQQASGIQPAESPRLGRQILPGGARSCCRLRSVPVFSLC